MRTCFVIFASLLITLTSQGQNTVNIDLAKWKGKKMEIPFKINAISDLRPLPEKIGSVYLTPKKKSNIRFSTASDAQLTSFVDQNFMQEESINVLLEINVLDIQNTNKNKKAIQNDFVFACTFYKITNTTKEPLYTFNAKNVIATNKNLKGAMTHYIARALNTAIDNFKKSLDKHPEWLQVNSSTPLVSVSKKIVYNDIMPGDSIPLDGKYQLKSADFVLKDDEKETAAAFSAIIMTYTLQEIEDSNSIMLHIYPKVFFLRTASWTMEANDENWLAHQQLLFDLASYHGYLFNKTLTEFKFSAGFYKAELNKLYNLSQEKYFDEMDLLQGETQFGKHLENERLWRKKVDAYLQKM